MFPPYRLLVMLCIGLVLGVCAESRAQAPKVAVKLALDWYPNANHLGLFIAQEKGYFQQENLDVTLYTPVDPSTVLQTVGSGQDEFGLSYQPDV
jgi:putative hydroxymethylpyrimidine transport system substrate-binding protein